MGLLRGSRMRHPPPTNQVLSKDSEMFVPIEPLIVCHLAKLTTRARAPWYVVLNSPLVRVEFPCLRDWETARGDVCEIVVGGDRSGADDARFTCYLYFMLLRWTTNTCAGTGDAETSTSYPPSPI